MSRTGTEELDRVTSCIQLSEGEPGDLTRYILWLILLWLILGSRFIYLNIKLILCENNSINSITIL